MSFFSICNIFSNLTDIPVVFFLNAIWGVIFHFISVYHCYFYTEFGINLFIPRKKKKDFLCIAIIFCYSHFLHAPVSIYWHGSLNDGMQLADIVSSTHKQAENAFSSLFLLTVKQQPELSNPAILHFISYFLLTKETKTSRNGPKEPTHTNTFIRIFNISINAALCSHLQQKLDRQTLRISGR